MMAKKGTVPTFTKAALVQSKKYEQQRDILNALLKDDREYTAEEVAEIVENFLKGKV